MIITQPLQLGAVAMLGLGATSESTVVLTLCSAGVPASMLLKYFPTVLQVSHTFTGCTGVVQ